MKKIFKVENLDCANCAARIESAVGKIDGVNEVSINFFAKKMTLEAADEVFEEVLEKAEKAAKRIEKDFCIVAI